MSILDEIKEHVDRGKLFEIPARDLRDIQDLTYRRSLYVSRDIAQELAHRVNEAAFRKLSAQFQSFTMGRSIPVALVPDHKLAEWARLGPSSDEVWESRVRKVKPELRILGRFAAVDLFVALNLYDSQLRGKKAWNAAKIRCQTDWAALFPQTPPVFGSTLYDYIRTNFVLI